MEKLYTVYEVAKLIKCQPQTIRIWIKRGKLTAIKCNGSRKWLIKESDLKAFIEGEGR